MQRRAVVTAAFVVVLGLAGCGDDDGDDEATTEDEGAVDDTDDGAGEGTGDGDGDGEDADVTIANFAFSPDELTVAAGDTLSVTNSDGSTHTFSSSDAGFDLSLGAGESGEVTVDAEPGTYDFQCNIHTTMTGSITVE